MIQRRVFQIGELRLSYAEGPDNGPPMVLLRGGTAHWCTFQAFLANLARWNAVYVLDFRDHGRSTHAESGIRLVDYAAYVATFLEAVPKEPAVLHGHSMGGAVAALVASQHPELVRAAILEDPGLFPSQYGAQMPEPPLLPSWRPSSVRLKRIFELNYANARLRAMDLSQLDPRVAWACVDGSLFEGFDVDDVLGKISCPVLLLRGELSQVLSGEQLAYVRAAIPACHVDVVADAGPFPHKTEADEVAAAIARFLSSP